MRIHDIAKDSSGAEKVLNDEQLKQLHSVFLMILDDITEICHKNGLTFVLIGGNALGAVRHHGFIPWDDDVDIAIPRKDYEKFINIVRKEYSEKYLLTDPRDRENYGKVIPKMRLLGTTYYSVLDHPDENHGIRIDVFPLENTYNNPICRFMQGIISYFFGFALSCRRFYKDREKYRQYSYISFKVKTAIGFFLSFASLEKWARWTDRWYAVCKNDKSKLVTIPSDAPFFFGSLVEREQFCTPIVMEYDGRKYPIPSNYDSYLKMVYGDYMTIPPIEKRIREQYIEYDISGLDEKK